MRLPTRLATPAPGHVIVLEHALSSMWSVLLVLGVSRGLSANEFGEFSVAYSLTAMAIAFIRTSCSYPVSLLRDASQIRHQGSDALTLVLSLSPLLVLAIGLIVVAAVGLSAPGLFMVVLTPLVLVQDVIRYIGIAMSRQGLLVVLNLAWVSLAMVAVLAGTWWMPLLAVGVGAIALSATMIHCLHLDPGISVSRGWSWFSMQWPLTKFAALSSIASWGSISLLWIILGNTAGAATVGGLALGFTAFGVLNILVSAFTLGGINQAVRLEPGREQRRFYLRRAGALLGANLLWSAVLVAVPVTWGVRLFGESWLATHEVLPLLALMYWAGGTAELIGAAFMATRRPGYVAVSRSTNAVLRLLVPTLIAVQGGSIQEIAAGLALAATVQLSLMLLLAWRTRLARNPEATA